MDEDTTAEPKTTPDQAARRLAQAQLLIDSRRYEQALALLTAPAIPPSRSWLAAHRRCLARMRRFDAASEIGRQVLGGADAPAADWFRQSQLLVRAGRLADAVQAARQALMRDRQTAFLGPLVEAVLRDPSLEPEITSMTESLTAPSDASHCETDQVALVTPDPAPAPVNVPMRHPYYAPLSGDHPFVMGWVYRTEAPACTIADGDPDFARLPKAFAFARARFQEYRHVHPCVTDEAAAAYVGSRFECLLYPCPGTRLDLLSMAVMSLGERPYVLVFDYLPVLFHPLYPYEDLAIDPKSPYYWIVRATLESHLCAAIITTYPSSARMLGRFFDSRRIEAKCRLINPCQSSGPLLEESVAEGGGADTREPATVLFTTSRHAIDETFYARGGVDVLYAFEQTAPHFPQLRLILRAPLPATLSPRLRRLVQAHPRIEWYPDPLPGPAFRHLFRRASLFALPGVTAYRNGLIGAMAAGVVPLVSDGAHMEDLVTDGRTGWVVPGRAGLSHFQEAERRFVQDWVCLLQATDGPADIGFAIRYTRGLQRLLSDLPLLARLRAANLCESNPHLATARDLERFRRTLAEALPPDVAPAERDVPAAHGRTPPA